MAVEQSIETAGQFLGRGLGFDPNLWFRAGSRGIEGPLSFVQPRNMCPALFGWLFRRQWEFGEFCRTWSGASVLTELSQSSVTVFAARASAPLLTGCASTTRHPL